LHRPVLIGLALCLRDLGEIGIHPVERAFPETAIAAEPSIKLLQWFRLQPARTPLRLAPTADQACAFQNLEVARNGGEGNVERLGQLVDRCGPLRQSRQDRPPGRIGERRERHAEWIGCCHLTGSLINTIAK
jgi:hypothetical protein